MTAPVHALVSLRAAGVGVLLDLSAGRLPAVTHWGADLGELTAAEAEAMVGANVAPVGPNQIDTPVRLALLPEHWTGWAGRPGLSGSRAGRSWSPKFETTALRVDGELVEATSERRAFVARDASRVEVDAVDETAGLGLTLTLELHPSGLLRAQARVVNLGDDPYQLDDLVLALPVPSVAREILDFGGRWGKEPWLMQCAFTIICEVATCRKISVSRTVGIPPEAMRSAKTCPGPTDGN